jgi:hypothetical protein
MSRCVSVSRDLVDVRDVDTFNAVRDPHRQPANPAKTVNRYSFAQG